MSESELSLNFWSLVYVVAHHLHIILKCLISSSYSILLTAILHSATCLTSPRPEFISLWTSARRLHCQILMRTCVPIAKVPYIIQLLTERKQCHRKVSRTEISEGRRSAKHVPRSYSLLCHRRMTWSRTWRIDLSIYRWKWLIERYCWCLTPGAQWTRNEVDNIST